MLPKIAADIGIEDELRLARQMSALAAARRGASARSARRVEAARSRTAGSRRKCHGRVSWRRSCACANSSCWPHSRACRTALICSNCASWCGLPAEPSTRARLARDGFPARAQIWARLRGGPALQLVRRNRRHRADDRLKGADEGQPVPDRLLQDDRWQGARRVSPGRRRRFVASTTTTNRPASRSSSRRRFVLPIAACASRARAAIWPRTRSASASLSCATTSCTSPRPVMPTLT